MQHTDGYKYVNNGKSNGIRHNYAAALYPWKTAESIMRHARRNSLPRTPTSLNELAAYFDNEPIPRFTCCDSSMFRGSVNDELGNRNVIFACPLLIRAAQENNIDEIHADATFKIVPRNLGTQLLSIHCMIQNYSIPIIYVLMESKCRGSYDCVLAFVKNNLIPNLTPSTIITDYEPALRDALVSQFPGAQAHGCWFHHNQAVWKNMRSRGYLQHVNTNQSALETLKLLFSLPLLPAREMESGFALIKAFATNHGVHMANLFDYYNRYWLQRVGPDIVSVHSLPRRTNNNLESFHNALRLKFSVAHPNLWMFLGKCHLSDLSKEYHTIVRQLGNNLQPTRNLRANFQRNSRNIKHATDQYNLGQITIWEFLKKCSYLSASYELRQRNWALGVGRDEPDNIIIENPNEEVQNNEREEINNQPPPHDPNPLRYIVKLQTSFIPQNVLFYQTPLMYSAVENVDDFQILYDGSIGNDAIGHWLSYHCIIILDILYPSKSNVVFKSVIKQPDGYSCGVFAIAFATSLKFGRNPSDECYIIDYNNMICKTWTLRNHLNNILVSTLLQPFPTHHSHVAQSTDILSLKNKKIKIIKTKTAIGRKKRKSIINKNIRTAIQDLELDFTAHAQNEALISIEDQVLSCIGKSLSDFGLPKPHKDNIQTISQTILRTNLRC
ncbi:hypothetical protein ACI65C_013856 [Semiaphis heraclei]